MHGARDEVFEVGHRVALRLRRERGIVERCRGVLREVGRVRVLLHQVREDLSNGYESTGRAGCEVGSHLFPRILRRRFQVHHFLEQVRGVKEGVEGCLGFGRGEEDDAARVGRPRTCGRAEQG